MFQKDLLKTVQEAAHTRYPLSIHFDSIWAKKVTKINLRIISKPHAHLQTMTKTPVKFQKDQHKMRRSCKHKVPTIYTLRPEKKTMFTIRKKWKQFSWVLHQNHMHYVTPCKTVGGVVHTRYPLSIHFDSTCIRAWKMAKFKMWKKWQKLIWGLYPNHMHIFRPCLKHL